MADPDASLPHVMRTCSQSTSVCCNKHAVAHSLCLMAAMKLNDVIVATDGGENMH